ncbi:MAG TPA: AmmeMemoRadiSam system radical SAM enzyme [Rectinemataceae bacterium]|nr:AmmeMemoRadiSam system radical SAM enzyme [Rectinemataceae bacterium]
MEAAWFSKDSDGSLKCLLCPHECRLREGNFGLCRVRGVSNGGPNLPFAGRISSLSDDPIEKKPLFRFLPGSRVFSVGFFGCMMRCPFCQNWEISQRREEGRPFVPPGALVEAAKESGSPSIAFTYSEPTLHFEYVLEAARLAKAGGLHTVLVTNGQLNEGPARELLATIDAVNLDIKSFSAAVYEKTLGGRLDTTLEFARLAAKTSWLEATSLIVPGLEDWESSIEGIASFLSSLSPHIPLHLSAYHPAWKHDAPPTSPALLEALRGIARRKLESVYVGNVAGESEMDRCGSCGTVLVERRGYRVATRNLLAAALDGPFAAKGSMANSATGEEASTGGIGSPLGRPGARCAVCGHPEFFVLS